ncbi:MAG: diguanylate cyclase [Eubacterium sp.]|nr:diguanylate cyclase [Eubacterium sp.]
MLIRLTTFLGAAIFAVVFCSPFFSFSGDGTIQEIIKLNEGWIVNVNGTLSHEESLTDAVIDNVATGSVITLVRRFDDLPSIYGASITFDYTRTNIRVYADDELIYSYGNDTDSEKYLSLKRHTIVLPARYNKKLIKIVLIPRTSYSFYRLSSIYFGDTGDLFKHWFKNSLYSIVTGGFLLFFGLILLILSPGNISRKNNNLRLLFAGLISVALGEYLLSYNQIFYLISGQAEINYLLYYGSIASIPIVTICYFHQVFKGNFRRVTLGMIAIDAAHCLLGIVIYVAFPSFNDQYLFTAHLMILVEGIIILSAYINKLRKIYLNRHDGFDKPDTIISIGMCAFILFAASEIIAMDMNRYLGMGFGQEAPITYTTLGVTFFIACIMLNYLLSSVNMIHENSTEQVLINAAYVDTLTQINNRAQCEYYMSSLDEEKNNDCFISMDLDHLKTVNDNYGHAAGDELLKAFANTLKACFPSAGLIGRMGGDEFLVILNNISGINLIHAVDNYELYLLNYTAEHPQSTLSCSMGVAFRNETESGTSLDTYLLADQRMYENKKLSHEQEGVS